MIQIKKATLTDALALTELGKVTFVQSHGHSAPESEISSYVSRHFKEAVFKKELLDRDNWYYLIYYRKKLVGYSKLNLNYSTDNISDKNVAKLERIYVLKEVYGLGIGKALFDFNLELAKTHQQKGIWLFTWVENYRGIRFYEKIGFKIVGKYDFPVSETHSNPNHQFFLEF